MRKLRVWKKKLNKLAIRLATWFTGKHWVTVKEITLKDGTIKQSQYCKKTKLTRIHTIKPKKK